MQISACYFTLIPLKQKFTTNNRNWLFVDARQVATTGVGLFENQKSVLIQEKKYLTVSTFGLNFPFKK